jgi:hypothetical protein
VAGEGQVTELGLGLAISWPSVACSDPSFPIPGRSDELTVPMCAKQGDVRLITAWLVAIMFAVYVFTRGASVVGGK